MRLRSSLKVSAYFSVGVVTIGILAILIAPMVWTTYTVWQDGGRRATAGPQTIQGESRGGGPSSSLDTPDPALMDYLQANRGDAKYLVATTNARTASPIILSIGEPDPVITVGGFSGRDPVLSTNQLTDLIERGAVRFFLVPDRERMMESQQEAASEGAPSWGWHGFPQNESATWVQDNCKQVPQELWQSSSTSDQTKGSREGAQLLYDCGVGGKS